MNAFVRTIRKENRSGLGRTSIYVCDTVNFFVFSGIFMFFNNFIFGNYVFADDFTSALDINASSALLVDNKTNKILYSKNQLFC